MEVSSERETSGSTGDSDTELDPWELIKALRRCQVTSDDSKAFDEVVQKLYGLSDEDLDFFLPQLCNRVVKDPRAESLVHLLLEKCGSLHFALRIHCWFKAAAEDAVFPRERTMQLCKEAEAAAIRARRPSALRRRASSTVSHGDSSSSLYGATPGAAADGPSMRRSSSGPADLSHVRMSRRWSLPEVTEPTRPCEPPSPVAGAPLRVEAYTAGDLLASASETPPHVTLLSGYSALPAVLRDSTALLAAPSSSSADDSVSDAEALPTSPAVAALQEPELPHPTPESAGTHRRPSSAPALSASGALLRESRRLVLTEQPQQHEHDACSPRPSLARSGPRSPRDSPYAVRRTPSQLDSCCDACDARPQLRRAEPVAPVAAGLARGDAIEPDALPLLTPEGVADAAVWADTRQLQRQESARQEAKQLTELLASPQAGDATDSDGSSRSYASLQRETSVEHHDGPPTPRSISPLVLTMRRSVEVAEHASPPPMPDAEPPPSERQSDPGSSSSASSHDGGADASAVDSDSQPTPAGGAAEFEAESASAAAAAARASPPPAVDSSGAPVLQPISTTSAASSPSASLRVAGSAAAAAQQNPHQPPAAAAAVLPAAAASMARSARELTGERPLKNSAEVEARLFGHQRSSSGAFGIGSPSRIRSSFAVLSESDKRQACGSRPADICDADTELLGLGGSPRPEPNRVARHDVFHSELAFLHRITMVGHVLKERQLKSKAEANFALAGMLRELQRDVVQPSVEPPSLPPAVAGRTGLYLPTAPAHKTFQRVVRLLPEECFALSSKERVPYMLYTETLVIEQPGPPAPAVTHHRKTPSSDAGAGGLMQALESLLTFRRESSAEDSGGTATAAVHQRSGREATQEANSGGGSGNSSDGDSEWTHIRHRADVNPTLVMAYPELWTEKEERIRKTSLFGHHPNWRLQSVVVKSGDDLRQEMLALQLVSLFHRICRDAEVPVWLRPYAVVPTSSNDGFIECIPDAISLDQLKKRVPNSVSLLDHFRAAYGESHSRFIWALRNFVESLAGYAVVCYLFQVKDRHNGNILLDKDGHLIHIDYGFFLTSSPGFIGFETAPFKLTQEYIALMGGEQADMFNYFKLLFIRAFLEARKHHDKFLLLVEMMLPGHKMSCFARRDATLRELEERFQLHLSDEEVPLFVGDLIKQSANNWRSAGYDSYQYYTQGILP